MSDILERRVANELVGPRISVAALFSDDPLAYLEAQLELTTKLTAVINLLFPDEQRAGEGTIDCAIRLLEQARADGYLPR